MAERWWPCEKDGACPMCGQAIHIVVDEEGRHTWSALEKRRSVALGLELERARAELAEARRE